MTIIFRSVCTSFLIAFLISGCVEEGEIFPQFAKTSDSDTRDPFALFISHLEDPGSMNLVEQVSSTLDYADIPYSSHELSRGNDKLKIPLTVKIVYLTTDRVEELTNEEVEHLIHFVAAGNQVSVLKPVYDDRIAFLLGLKYNTSYEIDRQASGYFFNMEIFPNYRNKEFTRGGNPHSGFKSSEFTAEKKILVTAADDTTYPVIVERSVGHGRAVYFNTYHMGAKDYRGLLFSTSLKALEGIPYRVANVSTIFLDDFPAPLYNRKMAPIDREYDITHAEFVQNVWWPDMKALADSFDINYTALLTFNYNATVVPPFNFDEWEGNKITIGETTQGTSSWLAHDINRSRHELGFHGYNHFSLWLKDWQNQGFMEAALRAARKRWIINKPGMLPRSYVPPTNEIDSTGLASIENAFPEIKYMSSLYNGDIEEGGGREFGPDPYVPSLFNYPRITSGFTNNESSNFNQNSLFLYTGIWTHFVHPDDVFQVNQRPEDDYKSRNPLGLGWHSSEKHDYGLYEVLKQRLKKTVEAYPFTRFETVSQSVPIVKKWLHTQSAYHFSDSTLQVLTKATRPGIRQNDRKFWFAYKSNDKLPQFEQAISGSGMDFAATGLWDGKLYQFSSPSDTLTLPFINRDYRPESKDRVIAGAIRQYRSFLTLAGTNGVEWQDRRLEEATAALAKNPTSIILQDRVIELANEFDTTALAIPILEKRLLKQPRWRTGDIHQLLKYYGWEGAQARAFSFLERLWSKYPDQSIVMLKNMMVDRYGISSQNFQKKWLRRAISLQPESESLLRQMVLLNDSKRLWAEQKEYIERLMDLNPRSDTLYHYALENALAHETPAKTLEWLHSFPDEAIYQLEPLAPDIAYLYAGQGKLTRAVIWGRRTDAVSAVEELGWLLQQKRYHDFIGRGKILMEKEPLNDSLRAFIGKQLIYEGFGEKGFNTLYPLFGLGQAPPETKHLVHSEIGYMDFGQKKQFYRSNPNFFTDSLSADLNEAYRKNEGFEIGTTTRFASDNYQNQIASIGLYTQWGNRAGTTYRLTVEEGIVSSDILNNHELNKLYHLNYRYQHSFRNQMSEFFVSGGAYFDHQKTRPELGAGFRFSRDSAFTSAQLQYEPVFTNHSIQRNISQITANMYREDYWFKKGGIQTALSLRGNWYSNDVFEYGGVFRLYAEMPFSTRFSKLRPVADVAYSDATENYLSSIPYYTPDHLFKQGVGLQYLYRDKRYNPDFSTDITLMTKHGNRDGIFFSGSARLSARINTYWQLSLEGALSTSEVYRYNNIGLNISFLLPATFTE